MIATYIAIGIARAFAGMGTGKSAEIQTGPLQGMTADITQADAGTLSSVFGHSFASGGYVSGPTRALVGEGGESEYIIPESKMRESVMLWRFWNVAWCSRFFVDYVTADQFQEVRRAGTCRRRWRSGCR